MENHERIIEDEKKIHQKILYLANPLGFSSLSVLALEKIIESIPNKWAVYEPFREAKEFGVKIVEIESNQTITLQKAKIQLQKINAEIGKKNEQAIRNCNLVVAILDGMPEDTGVAAEIGFAYALGKKIIGLRTDFRYAADNLGSAVNIQVEHFIRSSGGIIARSLQEFLEFFKNH